MLSYNSFWSSIIGAALFAVLTHYLAPILTPFLVAFLLAYMTNPLVTYLQKIHLPRTLGTVLVFALVLSVITLLILLFLPLLERQLSMLFNKIPKMIEWVQHVAVPWLSQKFDINMTTTPSTVQSLLKEHWQSAGSFVAHIIKTISQSGLAIIVWLTNLILVPVVAFYLLRDWPQVLSKAQEFFPHKNASRLTRFFSECNEVLGAFFRGQLLVMLALGIIYSLGLWTVGLDVAMVIGLTAGLVSIVPYLGFIVGITCALIAAVLQFHDVIHLVYIVVVFGIGQGLESMLLTPYLVGNRVGLHPVAVIFAILAGGQLFGFFGILLALPMASVIMVLLRNVYLSNALES